jgi:hypothetical protein
MKSRYIVGPPVPTGYFWWTIIDTHDKSMLKAPVAQMKENLPNAEAEVRALCDRLNKS